MSSFTFHAPARPLGFVAHDEARRRGAALAVALGAIVELAAERARDTGTLGLLREAIEQAMSGTAMEPDDPREAAAPDLTPIADADPALEAARLRALMARR
jgi:hypothetical protein